MMKDSRFKISLLVLSALYLAILLGLNIDKFRPDFLYLIPISLLFTFAIVLSLHRKWNLGYFIFISGSFLGGILIEVLALKSGGVFGNYHYSAVLGPRIAGAPLATGMIWTLLAYCAGMIGRQLSKLRWKRILIGAVLLVFAEFLWQHYGLKYGLWTWDNSSIPLRNYVGHFVVAGLMLTLFHYSIRKTYSQMAVWAYIVMMLYFLADIVLGKIIG